MHLCSLEHPLHFCLVVEVDGTRTRCEFQVALEAVVTRHQALSTVIVANGMQGPVLRQTKQAPSLRFMPEHPELGWREAVAAEIATSFDPRRDPMLRVTVLERQSGMVIILCAYHAVADGISMTFVLDDLLTALSGGALAPEPVARSAEEQVSALANFWTIQAAAPEPVAELPQDPRWRAEDDTRPRVQTASLNEDATTALVVRCRKERTTVHGAISAALAATLAELTGETTTTLYSPVDLRRTLDGSSHVSNLMFCGFRATLVGDADFWSTARHAVEGISAVRDLRNLATMMTGLERLIPPTASAATACSILGNGLGDHMLSNLGTLSLAADRAGLKIRAVWGPACTTHLAGYQFVGAATYRGVLRLINTTYDPHPGFLDAIAQRLAGPAALTPAVRFLGRV